VIFLYYQKTLEEDIAKWSHTKEVIKSSYKTFSTLCDPVYLEILKERVNDTMKKWEKLDGRLRNFPAMLVSIYISEVKESVLNKKKNCAL
jgi:hypothetical protein